MPELLLHYIWLQKVFMAYPQQTTDGRPIEVISVGQHNSDAGPDFFNATIRIGDILWVGNVEIHIFSSDWYKHNHHTDSSYDSIILHVVRKADKKVYNSQGEAIVQCELKYPPIENELEKILVDRLQLCNQQLRDNPALLSEGWKHFLLQDRMKKKTAVINTLLSLRQNHWEEAFYITLAHNFGFHTNGLPFEMMATQTPLAYLNKHKDSLFQLEAIIFGQSGLLNELTATDEQSQRWLREYRFMQKKFSLTPINFRQWKMLRMRPQNFPHVRLAQFAKLLNQSESLFSKIIATNDLNELRDLFSVTASEYWDDHYRFAAESEHQPKTLGKSAIDLLLINSVIPYKYAYYKMQNNRQLMDEAMQLLYSIPAEKNHIVDRWKALGLSIRSAADSQLFIQLYQNYCIKNRCTQCDVGYQIFTVKRSETASL